MTINQQPKAAMDAANSLPDPGALQGARRASGDVPGSAVPLRTPGPSMEVVPRAKRRVFSNADRRRILAAVYATLLDEDRCLGSVRTMYRLLAANGGGGERRRQLSHPAYTKPELLATAPNQV